METLLQGHCTFESANLLSAEYVLTSCKYLPLLHVCIEYHYADTFDEIVQRQLIRSGLRSVVLVYLLAFVCHLFQLLLLLAETSFCRI